MERKNEFRKKVTSIIETLYKPHTGTDSSKLFILEYGTCTLLYITILQIMPPTVKAKLTVILYCPITCARIRTTLLLLSSTE